MENNEAGVIDGSMTSSFELPAAMISPETRERVLGVYGIDLLSSSINATESRMLVNFIQHGASATMMDLVHSLQTRQDNFSNEEDEL